VSEKFVFQPGNTWFGSASQDAKFKRVTGTQFCIIAPKNDQSCKTQPAILKALPRLAREYLA